jgi:hypothetical protein
MNSLLAIAMTTLRISKGNPREINSEPEKIGSNDYYTKPVELR